MYNEHIINVILSFDISEVTLMQALIERELGDIIISDKVFQYLVGIATTNCFGVVGMAGRNKAGDIVKLLIKDAVDKGVFVKLNDDNKLEIDLHIIVEYGVNIPAITKSIINRVRYFIETTTGFEVCKIEVIVDSVRID